MKELRKYIRRSIMETLSGNQEAFRNIQQSNPDLTYGTYYSKGDRITIPDKYPETTSLRRDLKRHWNENADHEFMKEVICVHWINFIQNHESSKRSYTEALKRILYGNPTIRPGEISTNEFSTIGYLDRIGPKRTGTVGIVIKTGYRSFAATVDAWTEYNVGVSDEVKDYYRHSGLPKRPFRQISPGSVIYDREDFEKSPSNVFREITVDNWTWDTIVIKNSWKNDPDIVEMLEFIEKWNETHRNSIINVEYF